MQVSDYISVRRAYGRVRQKAAADERLTFPEFAILVRLDREEAPLKTSDIASWQSALRPTMTHRTKHLAHLGLIKREKGSADRRNVVCSLTEEGADRVARGCDDMAAELAAAGDLSDATSDDVRSYICAMGSVGLMAGDLVLVGIHSWKDRGASVGELVDMLGLLQPTVSMAINTLVTDGLVTRGLGSEGPHGHAQRIFVTDEGAQKADEIADRISDIEIA